MKLLLIKNAKLVNEGEIYQANLIVKNGLIDSIHRDTIPEHTEAEVIDARGLYLLPGVIDDQVHFREPGLTHKGDLASESAAAAAGGVTSFMEMPNTNPQTITLEELEKKFELAENKSVVNFSFYLGATNDNLTQVKKVNPLQVCGVKVFMGASTGNMLVDNKKTLEGIFAEAPLLIATHCEDEATIKANTERFKQSYGDSIPVEYHAEIRNAESCYKSSSLAVELASRYGSQLHILHLSTLQEMSLLESGPVTEKKITGEVCVHHLWFNNSDYKRLGSLIKWNPAIKSAADQQGLWDGLLANKLDVIATDHAPHTLEEKANPYTKSPSGGPLVQHSLVAMLECYQRGKISLERVVEKMCHAPADLYRIKGRGYLRPGYKADLVLVDLNRKWKVSKENILYKCGWSPFDGVDFNSKVICTLVNGKIVYQDDKIVQRAGERLEFNR
ncbi:MAG: dihydroorotase [Bacteroidota bacterium]|nr:MAG: dihydroorotase [Bacteroidota bacterium]